jgi:hypothetical protein
MNEQLKKFIGNTDLFDVLLIIAIVVLALNESYGAGWLLFFFFLKNFD